MPIVLAQNNYLSALGRTKGTMTSVNLVANTDLQSADEFRRLVVKEDGKGGVVRDATAGGSDDGSWGGSGSAGAPGS